MAPSEFYAFNSLFRSICIITRKNDYIHTAPRETFHHPLSVLFIFHVLCMAKHFFETLSWFWDWTMSGHFLPITFYILWIFFMGASLDLQFSCFRIQWLSNAFLLGFLRESISVTDVWLLRYISFWFVVYSIIWDNLLKNSSSFASPAQQQIFAGLLAFSEHCTLLFRCMVFRRS